MNMYSLDDSYLIEHIVWEWLRNPGSNGDPRPLMDGLPEYTHELISETTARMMGAYEDLSEEIWDRYYELEHQGVVDGSREEFIEAVKDLKPVVRDGLLGLLDDKPTFYLIWESLEPKDESAANLDARIRELLGWADTSPGGYSEYRYSDALHAVLDLCNLLDEHAFFGDQRAGVLSSLFRKAIADELGVSND